MKKTRAPDLTEERIKLVLDTLDGWKGKLTWDLLIEAVRKITGITYSRFTFAEYPEIANAFSLRKDALRGSWKGERGQPRDERVRAALEQVERYKAKIERLEEQNQLLLEQFVTWAHNAERKGVTVMMLNAPLPKPERDRTKGVK
jgi:predicted ribosome quality control (RQC) complex YloA/Tae2 family protein